MSLSDLRLLRSFVTVAEELHVGRAARRLNITQPPLTRRLKQLERELGVALFDRRRRRLALTPAGREFRAEARGLLDRADRAIAALRSAAGVETDRLRIGFVEAATASGLLPGAMARLRRLRPGVRYELQELPSLAQAEALRREDIDVGTVYNRPGDTRGLELRTILPGRCIAVMARTHPLARRRRVSLGDLAGGPVILWGREINPARYDATLAAFRAARTMPRVLHHAEQLQTIVSLAAAGSGVGLVPDSEAKVSLGAVVYRRIRGFDIPMDLELVWRTNEPSSLVAEFVAAMEAEAKRSSRRR
jgi:DNA-binding transcriptional LysR family regulator